MFTPGISGNPNGRQPGTPNKTTREHRELITAIVNRELENIDTYLSQLEPYQRIEVLIKLLPYTCPKIAPTKEEPGEMIIRIVDESTSPYDPEY